MSARGRATPDPLTWMRRRLEASPEGYQDSAGCADLTRLVEDYDHEVLTGSATLDPEHPAWDAAVQAVKVVGGFNE